MACVRRMGKGCSSTSEVADGQTLWSRTVAWLVPRCRRVGQGRFVASRDVLLTRNIIIWSLACKHDIDIVTRTACMSEH